MSTAGVRIGLEVHVPLATRAKLFCRCQADPSDEANRRICPTCTGQPGARPQGVNRRAVEQAVRAARVLGCELEATATVQRKHYVYPDLPNNYQRTSTPIARDGTFWGVPIEEIHIEEDPGAFDPDTRTIDLDRSGTPLVEIVTRPVLGGPTEVDRWIGVLRLALDRAGIVRPGAELKADVNVSTAGGDRVEVKNVVGGKNAARAATFEIDRQQDLRDEGKPVPRETRHFEEDKGITRTSRTKETVGDYRYMPDPDLHPVDISGAANTVEAPRDIPARLEHLIDEHGLTLGEAVALLEEAMMEELFDRLSERVPPERALEVALRRLRGELEYRETRLSELGVDLKPVIELAEAWEAGEITKHVFTRLLRRHLDGGDVTDELADERSAEVEIEQVIDAVLDANQDAIDDYHAGSEGAIDYLVGQVMARTQGRADPKRARQALAQRLDADEG